ncbi:MAG: bifunctional metallophosphatase/5'-nucleotidase [Candidatus Acidiferrales bacterium]
MLQRRNFLQFVLCAVLALGLPAGCQPGASAESVQITLLGTTDLHGNLFPVDYYSNKPANRGLAKIATLIRQVRSEQPNVLLLDSGDTIQGTPLAYYFARKEPAKPNPTIALMNALGYDAMATGNHEFNFGLDVLLKAKSEAKFPWLAANIEGPEPTLSDNERVGHPEFPSHIIKQVAGVKVGIVGFITPGVPRWEIPAHYRGYAFHSIVETAKRVIPEVRKQVDLLVVIAHSGLERDAQTGESREGDQIPGENAIWALAEQVPGIDVILYGHSHREMPEKIINGVLLAQARNWGQSLARADVTMTRDDGGKWRVTSKKSTVIPVTDSTAPDPQILALARPYHEATQVYLDAPVATSAVSLKAATARYEDHPFVDLIHRVQLEYGKADVSFATMFLTSAAIPAGPVTVRQIASLYIYENTLYTVEMTGAQLAEALEHAAGFYPAWPVASGQRLRLPGYNADCAQGVEYEIDLTQPPGKRVRNLTRHGQPLNPAAKLRVAINNYRYAGGGYYKVFQGLPILYRSPQEVRELMIEYVTRTGALPATADNNWRIVPRAAVDAMIREATTSRSTQPADGP